MSHDGQPANALPTGVRFALEDRGGFDWHHHPAHQIALAERGVIVIAIGSASFVLPRSRAMFVPAGVEHAVIAEGETVMLSAYIPATRCPLDWSEATVVDASGLVGELIVHLCRDDLDDRQRAHGETLLWDVLRPMDVTALSFPMPRDDRARAVADGVLADVTDSRSLAEWGSAVGASSRTLARRFDIETGMSFAQWRTNARLAAALPLLGAGRSVQDAALAVGYGSASAFVAAFKREIGSTPAEYFGRTRLQS